MTDPKMPYITGYCQVGACEGSNKKSAAGASFTPCRGTYVFNLRGFTKEIVCQHDCHEAFAQIRALVADMSPPVDFPAIVMPAQTKENASPDTTTTPAQTPGSGAVVPFPMVPMPNGSAFTGREPESPPSHLTTKVLNFAPRFEPTPSGRAAKGQLEENVRQQLKIAHSAGAELLEAIGLTPAIIAKKINPDKPPSNGAVYAIFKRWEAAGYVTLADKPFRLVAVTDLGQRNLIRP